MLNFPSPNTATNQLVMVVPTLAPKITPIEPTRSNNPALTKLTTMTVVAEEPCIRASVRRRVPLPAARTTALIPFFTVFNLGSLKHFAASFDR